MGRRGPAPQPTEVKKARGNPGKRRLNDAEPKPDAPKRLDAPSWLTGIGRTRWNSLAPKLAAAGLLTVADFDAFARYCDTWARWRACCRVIDRQGATYEMKDEKGAVKCIVQRPEVSMAIRYAQQLSRLEQEFGMTPSARSRVEVRIPTPGAGGDRSAADAQRDEINSFDGFAASKRTKKPDAR